MSDYTYKLTAFSKIILIYPIIAYYFINKEFIGLRLFFPVEEHKILLIAISFFVGVYVLLMKVNRESFNAVFPHPTAHEVGWVNST